MSAKQRAFRGSAILAAVIAALILSITGIVSRIDTANAAPKPAGPAGKNGSSTDDLQRSGPLDTYPLPGESGPARGENIYFYKCWMCHNKYAKTGPNLKDLYQRQ